MRAARVTIEDDMLRHMMAHGRSGQTIAFHGEMVPGGVDGDGLPRARAYADIAPGPGEVAVKVWCGDGRNLPTWVVGDFQEVLEELLRRRQGRVMWYANAIASLRARLAAMASPEEPSEGGRS